MSDGQFTFLFWVLLFIAVALFAIGVMTYALLRRLRVWQADWYKWRGENPGVNAQARKAEGEARVRAEMEKAMQVKVFCDLGAHHLRMSRHKSVQPDVLADQQEAYERRKQSAIGLARQLGDAPTRDLALGFIVKLCMNGGDESEAKKLFGVIEDDLIRDDILTKYQQLAATS
jgi:hypothetical protein